VVERWANLSKDQIAGTDKTKAVVMLPLASTEQHGPHLPVGTDAFILEELTERFIRESGFAKCDVVFAPPLPIGKSNEHMGFPGTLTFGAKTYYDAVCDIVRSVAAHGFMKIVLFNSHGGNTDSLNVISRDLRVDLGVNVFVFDWWFTNFWEKGLAGLRESGTYGVFHACELETSLMLAAKPETVRMDLAVNEEPAERFRGDKYVTVFGPVTAGWKTEDVTKSGVIGAPGYATAEKGEKLFAYAVRELYNIVSEVADINY